MLSQFTFRNDLRVIPLHFQKWSTCCPSSLSEIIHMLSHFTNTSRNDLHVVPIHFQKWHTCSPTSPPKIIYILSQFTSKNYLHVVPLHLQKLSTLHFQHWSLCCLTSLTFGWCCNQCVRDLSSRRSLRHDYDARSEAPNCNTMKWCSTTSEKDSLLQLR